MKVKIETETVINISLNVEETQLLQWTLSNFPNKSFKSTTQKETILGLVNDLNEQLEDLDFDEYEKEE